MTRPKSGRRRATLLQILQDHFGQILTSARDSWRGRFELFMLFGVPLAAAIAFALVPSLEIPDDLGAIAAVFTILTGFCFSMIIRLLHSSTQLSLGAAPDGLTHAALRQRSVFKRLFPSITYAAMAGIFTVLLILANAVDWPDSDAIAWLARNVYPPVVAAALVHISFVFFGLLRDIYYIGMSELESSTIYGLVEDMDDEEDEVAS